MSLRVLFVDDEQNVLSGLRRMLHKSNIDWQSTFVLNGHEALKILETQPHDVVISDMRMPGMDGAELLTIVRDRYPSMIRIILSGHSEKEVVLRSVPVAHQFLSKPCEPEKLKNTIINAYHVQNLINDEQTRRVVANVTTLPSLPHLYTEILTILRDENASLSKVGEIIRQDIGMTANILKLVNSSFFGLPTHIANPVQAVNLLGAEVIKGIVLSAHVFSSFRQHRFASFSLEKLFNHSIITGTLSKKIAEFMKCDRRIIDDSFIAGLLHDLGKLIMVANFETTYETIITHARKDNRTIWEIEKDLLQTSHAEIGAYLVGLWGMSGDVVEAIAFHHDPSPFTGGTFTPLAAVHMANIMEHRHYVINKQYSQNPLDEAFLHQVGALEHIESINTLCAQYFSEVRAHEPK